MTAADIKIAQVIMSVLDRGHHVGRANAIPRRALLASLAGHCINIDDRRFRKIYTSAYCPVCTGDSGMFIPRTWAEVVDYLRYYSTHVTGPILQRRTQIMTVAYQRLYSADFIQRPLFSGEKAAEATA